MSRFGRVYTPISQPVLALPELDHPVRARVVEEDRLAVDQRAHTDRGGVVTVGVAEVALHGVQARIDDALVGVIQEPRLVDCRAQRRGGLPRGRATAAAASSTSSAPSSATITSSISVMANSPP